MHESAVALQQPTALYGFSPVPFGKELCRFFQKIGAVVLRMIPSNDMPANFDSLHCLHGTKTTLYFFHD
jgi:hypothetical protein